MLREEWVGLQWEVRENLWDQNGKKQFLVRTAAVTNQQNDRRSKPQSEDFIFTTFPDRKLRCITITKLAALKVWGKLLWSFPYVHDQRLLNFYVDILIFCMFFWVTEVCNIESWWCPDDVAFSIFERVGNTLTYAQNDRWCVDVELLLEFDSQIFQNCFTRLSPICYNLMMLWMLEPPRSEPFTTVHRIFLLDFLCTNLIWKFLSFNTIDARFKMCLNDALFNG